MYIVIRNRVGALYIPQYSILLYNNKIRSAPATRCGKYGKGKSGIYRGRVRGSTGVYRNNHYAGESARKIVKGREISGWRVYRFVCVTRSRERVQGNL